MQQDLGVAHALLLIAITARVQFRRGQRAASIRHAPDQSLPQRSIGRRRRHTNTTLRDVARRATRRSRCSAAGTTISRMSRCRAWGAFAGASYVMPPLSTPSRGPRRRRRAAACFGLALVQKFLDLLPEPRGAVEHLGVELVVLRE